MKIALPGPYLLTRLMWLECVSDRVLLTPDCGFAAFADNPVTSSSVAEAKLRAIVEAAELVRQGG